MAETTGISWADATWNPWLGCQKTGSPACEGCYAEALVAGRFGRAVWGGPHLGPGTRVRTSPSTWALPRKLEKQAVREGRTLFCFCASLADIFDPVVDPAWRADAFTEMRAAPHVTFLLLTKRPQVIVKLSEAAGGLPPNAALLTTVVTQAEVDKMVPELLIAGAQLRPQFLGLSIEPMVEHIDIAWALSHPLDIAAGLLRRGHFSPGMETLMRIRWVICGGGTDQGKWKAPPMHPALPRSLRDQCAAYGTAFHLKQWGEFAEARDKPWSPRQVVVHADGTWVPNPGDVIGLTDTIMERIGKKRTGRTLDGQIHDARPALRVAA